MTIFLEIFVPYASFKHSYSREYFASYSYPPPSTIYGSLLSLVGETDRELHRGVKLAISLISKPKISTVMRTTRRLKNPDINHPGNSKPDFQQVLSDIRSVVGIDSTEDEANLENRIRLALQNPERIDRFGGLSLGESRDLIDNIKIISELSPLWQWLVRDPQGKLQLPLSVDYFGSKETKMGQFSLADFSDRTFFRLD